jgi:two-component system, chemotaxis family, response regulator Rcp1
MSSQIAEELVEVLLVEDNPGDVRLTEELLKTSRFPNHLTIVNDGEEALSFLYRKGKYAEAQEPHLILLDLNLPRKSGHEVLARIKRDVRLRRIPVIVLSGSQSPKDIYQSYYDYANCYITKPVGLANFTKVMRTIEDFWFGVVRHAPDQA